MGGLGISCAGIGIIVHQTGSFLTVIILQPGSFFCYIKKHPASRGSGSVYSLAGWFLALRLAFQIKRHYAKMKGFKKIKAHV
jgi:hypothetical protein